MKINCQNCGSTGNIKDELIKEKGRFVTCRKCNTRFFVEKPVMPDAEIINELDKEKSDVHYPSGIGFIAAECPKCGGSLQVPENKKVVYCSYCGSNIILTEEYNEKNENNTSREKIKNFINLGDRAYEAKNFIEAYEYFKKALEIDTDNYEACLGKALSAGWMSSIRDCRLPETIIGISNAIKMVPELNKNELKLVSDKLYEISLANYINVRDYLKEHFSLSGTSEDYLNLSKHILDTLELSYKINPIERIAKMIIHICSENVKEIALMNVISGTTIASGQYELEISEVIDKYHDIMLKFDPNYQLPSTKNAPSNCFVVTATMGNENNYEVTFLKNFRDKWLSNKKYGRAFISFYYKIGPYFAIIIEKSIFLRQISYLLIVKPCIAIINHLDKKKQ